MQKKLLITAGCAAFGLSLLAHMPARWVLPEHSGRLQLLGVGGSLLQGEVRRVLFSGKALPVQDLQWTFRPLSLLAGEFEADIHERQTPLNQGSVSLGALSHRFSLRSVHWQLPAGSLDAWTPIQGLAAKGQVVLDLQTLQIAPGEPFPGRLEGQLTWQDAGLRIGPEDWRIGSPLMQFANDGGAIAGTMTNTEPPLPGNGSFRCTADDCVITLNLQPSPGTPQSVLGGLALLGLVQTGAGYSGQFTLPFE